jgi:hypothetical protein
VNLKFKLLISHEDMSEIYEVVDSGIPVLEFLLFCDQPRNIDNLVDVRKVIFVILFFVTKYTFQILNKTKKQFV